MKNYFIRIIVYFIIIFSYGFSWGDIFSTETCKRTNIESVTWDMNLFRVSSYCLYTLTKYE